VSFSWQRIRFILLIGYTANFASNVAADPRIIYVSQSATGSNQGTSWTDAYLDLQDAFEVARSDDQIWVAAGRYTPDRGTKDRTKSFTIPDGVELYGGFAGTESDPSERNIDANPTILSGDLLGNDNLSLVPTSNCCSIHNTHDGCDDPTCTALVVAANSHCMNPHFIWSVNCVAEAEVLCGELCRPTRSDNTYQILRAKDLEFPVALDGLTVTAGEGQSQTTGGGGALYLWNSTALIRNSNFTHNGGSAVMGTFSNIDADNCRFSENGPFKERQAALYSAFTSIRLANCSFLNNNGGGGESHSNSDYEVTVERCSFDANIGNYGGLFVDTDVVIRDCSFTNNQGTNGLGGGLTIDFAFGHVYRSVFIGNSSSGEGGGIFADLMYIEDSLLAGNVSRSPGGAISGYRALAISNCTIAFNRADSSVGGVGVSGPLSVTNSIFWGNQGQSDTSQNSQIFAWDAPIVSYSIVQNWDGTWGGIGNNGSDPMFADPLGPDGIAGTEDDDLRLSPGSPAIDAGDPSFVPQLSETDLDGHARVLCSRIDIGAYEFGIGDYDCSRWVNVADFTGWTGCVTGPRDCDSSTCVPYSPGCESFDFDSNLNIDLADFANFQNLFDSSQ